MPATSSVITYADTSSIGSAYQTVVTAIQQAGILMVKQNNQFHPKANATCAEVSAMLHLYTKLTIDPVTAQGWARNDDGQYMYYQNGKSVTGWQTIDGVKYFFITNGTLKTGWVKDDAGNLYFYSGNIRTTGWRDIESKRYYFTKDGFMLSGKWLGIDGKWYYFYDDGALARSTKIG